MTHKNRTWLTIALVASTIMGCGRPAPPVKPAIPVKPIPGPTAPTSPSDNGLNAYDEPPEPDVSINADIIPPNAIAELPPPSERFLLLAPDGPLLVEVSAEIDGEPYTEALKTLTDQMLAAADTDGDGQATWDEVLYSPQFRYGQFGNLPIEDDDARKQIRETYDINRDGNVDWNEVPRFLTRNAGGAKSFSLRGSSEYRNRNRLYSPIRRLLDQDGDGFLSQDEVANGRARLLAYDANDDGNLMVDEFIPDDSDQRMGAVEFGARPAFLVYQHSNWNNIHFALSELYAFGGEVDASVFAWTPDLFQLLDHNEDSKLDYTEVELLLKAEPHLKLHLNFNNAPPEPIEGQTNSVDPIQCIEVAPALIDAGVAATEAPNHVVLQTPKGRLTFYVNDRAPPLGDQSQAQSFLTMYDADGNNYLDAEEAPEDLPGVGSFEAVDLDGDGKVYVDEIATYLNGRQAVQRAQIRSMASYEQDALFQAMDFDSDGRLTSRELEAFPKRIATLDANHDGRISVDEIPDAMVVGFVRGDPTLQTALFVRPPITSPADQQSSPEWFQRMDHNQDGEISRREFLGDETQFESLDVNKDGFVQVDELRIDF